MISMEEFNVIPFIILIIWGIISYIRYEPTIDIINLGNHKYIILLWYSKHSQIKDKEEVKRSYIKLFEI